MPADNPPESEERRPEKSTVPFPGFERPPERIGPYRILEPIGEGGMGTVYLAEQAHPVRRRVALKIIKLGMDTKEVIARFEAERQALALMNHPNIAKVLDAGATEQGRPYFVMEHVEGVPITEHCDRHRLGNRERIGLFIGVCEAVHHAHQKGIIHRDLKPSNVLVAIQEGKPVPKVIDFGVAKATSQKLTERTVFTEQGQLIGTPEYMSPEQAEMTGQSVDTTTDVYSLGVMLYELLAGVLPFDGAALRAAGYEGIQRIIREEEPPTPSARVSKLGQTGTVVAKRRKTDVGSLRRQLRGELDWVTLRAIEKDRSRRYPSASELAGDLGRYLRNEPVMARPQSAAYQMSKMVARHRVPFAFAGVLFLVVVASGVWMSVLYGRAMRAEREAVSKAETATRVSEFLEGLFEVSDPSEALGETITAREILDEGAEKIDAELQEEPEVQAALMNTMGSVYKSLGLYDSARPLLERAVATRRKILGVGHPEFTESLDNLANLLVRQGHPDEAETLHREVLESRRELLGHEHPQVAWSMVQLATRLRVRHEYDEAERLYREALAMNRALLGDESLEVADNLSRLVGVLRARRDYDGMEQIAREVLAIRRNVLGEDHLQVVRSLDNLASVLWTKGDFDEGERLYREALAVRRRVFGEEHPEVANGLVNFSSKLSRRDGRQAEAERLLREALAMRRKVLGESHPLTVATMGDLATLFVHKGDREEADRLLREALAKLRGLVGEEYPAIHKIYYNLGILRREMGDYEQAESLYKEALARAKGYQAAIILYNLACLKAIQGEQEQSLRYLRESVERGFDEAEWMGKDPELEILHENPEFEAIVAEARKQSPRE